MPFVPTHRFNVCLGTPRGWHELHWWSLQRRHMSGDVLDWQHSVRECGAQSKQFMPELPTGNIHHQLDRPVEWFDLYHRSLQRGLMSGRLWHRWGVHQYRYGESDQPLQELPAIAVKDGLV